MDRHSRSIILSLVLVMGLTGIALVASVFVRFDVDHLATIEHFTGTVEISSLDEDPVTLQESQTRLNVGQTVQVQPDGTATISFFENGGRAVMTGPSSLRLVADYRRATSPGHLLDKNRGNVLTLEQSSGTVRYIFNNTTPAFDDLQLTIQLPDENYTPTDPCWQISIDIDGKSQIEPVKCTL